MPGSDWQLRILRAILPDLTIRQERGEMSEFSPLNLSHIPNFGKIRENMWDSAEFPGFLL